MRITDDNGYNAAGKRRKAYCVAHLHLRMTSFFAKKLDTLDAVRKPRTLLSCMGGFSGIGNASKTIRFAFVFA
jgi:hypothetical protein